MSFGLIPALSRAAAHLPYVGALSAGGLAIGLGTAVLLFVTERNLGVTATESTAAKMKELLIPMFIGFLLGGCPGMMAAVGIARLYRLYTTPHNPPDRSSVELLFGLSEITDWCDVLSSSTTSEADAKEVAPDVNNKVGGLLPGGQHSAARLQIACRLATIIPVHEELEKANSIILSASSKAVFGISDYNSEFRGGNSVGELFNSIVRFLSSNLRISPKLEDLFHFAFLVGSFADTQRDGVNAVVDYVVRRLQAEGSSMTLDELLQLSCIYSQKVHDTDTQSTLDSASVTKLSQAILAIVLSKNITTPAERLKSAQIYRLVGSDDAEKPILAKGIRKEWLTSSITTPPESIEDVTVLLGAGYLKYQNPLDSEPEFKPLTPSELEARRQNLETWFAAAIKHKGTVGNLGTWLSLRQYCSGEEPESVRQECQKRIDEMLGSDSKLTFEQLLQEYVACSLIIPSSMSGDGEEVTRTIEEGSDTWRPENLLNILKSKINSALSDELKLAQNQGNPDKAIEMVMKTIAATNTTVDYSFTLDIMRTYHSELNVQLRCTHVSKLFRYLRGDADERAKRQELSNMSRFLAISGVFWMCARAYTGVPIGFLV